MEDKEIYLELKKLGNKYNKSPDELIKILKDFKPIYTRDNYKMVRIKDAINNIKMSNENNNTSEENK